MNFPSDQGADPTGNVNPNSGYCSHSSVLFPTWHRAYLAMFEVGRLFVILAAEFKANKSISKVYSSRLQISQVSTLPVHRILLRLKDSVFLTGIRFFQDKKRQTLRGTLVTNAVFLLSS